MKKSYIDFTDCKDGYRDYGGSDNKRSIEYNGEKYMLKLPELCKTRNDLQTSHVNNVFSEYLGSHIIASLGLPTHETILGSYNGQPAVACKDFTGDGYKLQEFSWLMRSMYDKSEIGRIPTYAQVNDVMQHAPRLMKIRDQAIGRYWDTFIADALIGNFDRHKGNWGYLVNEDTKDIKLAPIYDCGSCLYPGLSEDKMEMVLGSKEMIEQRMYEFPKAALNLSNSTRKEDKAVYYEFIASGRDKNCTASFIRMYPRINMTKIDGIIEYAPFLSDKRIDFYKAMLHYRKDLILDKAYEQLRTPELDAALRKEAYKYELECLDKKAAEFGISKESEFYCSQFSGLREKYSEFLVEKIQDIEEVKR